MGKNLLKKHELKGNVFCTKLDWSQISHEVFLTLYGNLKCFEFEIIENLKNIIVQPSILESL